MEGLTARQEAAAMHGLATNPGVSTEVRLRCALQALEFYTKVQEDEEESKPRPLVERDNDDTLVVTLASTTPNKWKNLIEGLCLLSVGATGNSPTHCEHNELTVCSDPHRFNRVETERLEELGFHADHNEDSFKSSRFGSA